MSYLIQITAALQLALVNGPRIIQFRQLKGEGCPGPLPGAKGSPGKMEALDHRGIFLEETTEFPALRKSAGRKTL